MKRVAVLGSTGSVGENALRVIEAAADRFEVVGLAAGTSWRRLAEQIESHRPLLASVGAADSADKIGQSLGADATEVLSGEDGLRRVASMAEADVVVMAVSGAAALGPTMAAIEAGKTVALANKECLVMAGEMVMDRARDKGVTIVPVDSEHAGVFQALAGRPIEEVARIILPASGGPFLDADPESLKDISPEQAVAHPTWSMGKKISVDSATLMNKALEIVEAHWLFGIDPSRIEVIIHPDAIMHAAIEFVDGSMVAQLSHPDMRYPIIHALAWPERVDAGLPRLDLATLGTLNFRPLDKDKFPAPGLAYQALQMGGTATAVLAAADEAAVNAFLQNKIPFTKIVPLIAEVLDSHRPEPVASVEDAIRADAWARREIEHKIK